MLWRPVWNLHSTPTVVATVSIVMLAMRRPIVWSHVLMKSRIPSNVPMLVRMCTTTSAASPLQVFNSGAWVPTFSGEMSGELTNSILVFSILHRWLFLPQRKEDAAASGTTELSFVNFGRFPHRESSLTTVDSSLSYNISLASLSICIADNHYAIVLKILQRFSPSLVLFACVTCFP